MKAPHPPSLEFFVSLADLKSTQGPTHWSLDNCWNVLLNPLEFEAELPLISSQGHLSPPPSWGVPYLSLWPFIHKSSQCEHFPGTVVTQHIVNLPERTLACAGVSDSKSWGHNSFTSERVASNSKLSCYTWGKWILGRWSDSPKVTLVFLMALLTNAEIQ